MPTDEEMKKFEEYQKATGGEDIIGFMVPFGYPPGVEERGGVIAVYDECIKKGVTWEELLGWNPPEDADI
jgi:hypothetical protein